MDNFRTGLTLTLFLFGIILFWCSVTDRVHMVVDVKTKEGFEAPPSRDMLLPDTANFDDDYV
jgi:hypothetical protein